MLPRVEAQLDAMQVDDARAVLVRAGDADDLQARLVREAPSRTAYRGLCVLAVHLRARRALLFERFCALWRAQSNGDAWASARAASSPSRPVTGRSRARSRRFTSFPCQGRESEGDQYDDHKGDTDGSLSTTRGRHALPLDRLASSPGSECSGRSACRSARRRRRRSTSSQSVAAWTS